MAGQVFSIEYSNIPKVSFPSKTGMEKYLKEESKVWTPLLEEIAAHNQLQTINANRRTINADSLRTAFDRLIKKIDNPREFNRATQQFQGDALLPPPSSSIEGQLILGLFENNRKQDAFCAYIWFVNHMLQIQENSRHEIGRMIDRGKQLSIGAYAAEALPFRQTSSQKLAGAARSAEAHALSLSEEVKNAQAIKKEHEEELLGYRELWQKRAAKIEKLIVRRERHRRNQHKSWIKVIESQVEDKFLGAERRLDALNRANKQVQDKRQAEFDKLLDLFHTQLRLRAPVQLWEKRSTQHSRRSVYALYSFGVLTLITIGAGALIPFLVGDYIAGSFFTQVCDEADPATCQREFSAKGPLTIGGILVIISLMMWTIRLQYRVFLSERHLALDASEKQAFAETFLAMREGDDVGAGNEAIVLASLFRPTQDGIINDDESAVDLSAAAILAKQLGRSGN